MCTVGTRAGPGWPLTGCVASQSKKRNRKHSGDDSFDEGSVSESESGSESGQAEEEKEESGGIEARAGTGYGSHTWVAGIWTQSLLH